MSGRRVYFVDWLRVLAVLLLFPYHAGRVFNVGEAFYVKAPVESLGISFLLGMVGSWHMALLFMLAGISTYYALRKRTTAQYAGERATRLLVPLAFGIVFLVPPQTWLGARMNAGYTGSLLGYFTSGAWLDASNLFTRGDYWGGISPAHLWFILFLWVIAMVSLPLLAWGRTDGGCGVLCRVARAVAKPRWWPVLVLAMLISSALPDLGGKMFFAYLLLFALGYTVAHQEAFFESAERWRVPSLVAGALITGVTVVFSRVGDSLPDMTLLRALWMYAVILGAWLVMVGIFGFGKAYLDRPSKALSYLGEASYPVYILHQTIIIAIAFYVVQSVAAPFVGWPVIMVASAAVTFALYEVVRRARPLRFVFGMRAKPTAVAAR